MTANFGGAAITANFVAANSLRRSTLEYSLTLFFVTTWSANKLVFCFYKRARKKKVSESGLTNFESAKLSLVLAAAAK
jgi:hypothetical protein